MFTGIVEELGTLEARTGHRVRIAARAVLEDASLGDSIAVNGCCLTVVDQGEGWWEADLSDETIERTSLGGLAAGDPVNLERPLRLADRLGGHLVQGHVDGTAEVLAPTPDLRVSIPEGLGHYLVEKGSITVDGVSLTVASLALDDDPPSFTVAVIPHTSEVTNLGRRRVGQRVNLEVDVVAKYVESMMRGASAQPSPQPGAAHE
ncbi:MAG: riboflavin synthase [Microthrixaceae bacterium]|nr:riboflavin synthase [Microthrixaceae bacterium]